MLVIPKALASNSKYSREMAPGSVLAGLSAHSARGMNEPMVLATTLGAPAAVSVPSSSWWRPTMTARAPGASSRWTDRSRT